MKPEKDGLMYSECRFELIRPGLAAHQYDITRASHSCSRWKKRA